MNKLLNILKLSFFIMLAPIAIADTLPTISGNGFLYRTIDGDTFDINIENPSDFNKLVNGGYVSGSRNMNKNWESVRMRLKSINTEESVHKNSSKNTEKGKEISKAVKRFESKPVKWECYGRGKYGRAICSISVENYDIGLWLIENGYSDYVKHWGEHPTLHQIYEQAHRSRR